MKLDSEQVNLSIELFPHCNLSCKFCYQDKIKKFFCNSKKYNKNIDDKIIYLDKAINSFKKLNLKRVDNFAFWGGEMFYDRRSEYMKKMIELIEIVNPRSSLEINTNLMCVDNELTDYLLGKEHNYTVDYDCSYNPVNMYTNKKQETLFLNNLKKIKEKYNLEYVPIFTVLQEEVLLQQCDLSVLDEIYKDKTNKIYFYISMLKYSDEVRKNFSKYLLEFYKRYPKCVNIENLTNNNNKKQRKKTIACHCHDKNSIFLSYSNDFAYIPDSTCKDFGTKTKYYNLVTEKFKCKECKYYSLCQDICCTDLVLNDLIDSCYQKFLYEHLRELNDTI